MTFESQFEYWTSMMKPPSNSFFTSSRIAMSFSTEWFLHFCRLGLRLRLRPNLSTITPTRIPGMSARVNTKNAINSSRSVLVNEPLICTHLSGSSRFKGIGSIASPDCAYYKVASSRWSSFSAAFVLPLEVI
ncbi:hypothetical protein Nepgr_011424 [Nepenthes gracilis]|uniref:Uncharacterized protein n=1 Tax=Nepenthes gracilis TaxID=150966 RepID=A0AAD3XLY2_NEPGR|nr:hypothetical protein Nepgr_011424 [Nepenthes gracilis]